MGAENNKIRTYIYYSDDKVNEIAQQLSAPSWWRKALRRISGVQGQIAGTGVGVDIERGEPEPTLQTLQKVSDYLDQQREVGTFDDPGRYFHGQLRFYHGIFDVVNPPVFFLLGSTGKTIVALGGSKKHVRGFRDQEVRAAENAQSVTMEPDVAELIHAADGDDSTPVPAGIPPTAQGDSWAIHVAGMYLNWQHSQRSNMEFEVLARREAYSRVTAPFLDSPKDVLIGSPIFVAQA
ncbi:DUF7019 family protein [Streptomyces griseochromogenes]|uniref:DUF7019 family protein n=1 Tax=Streptomyces griseochromogenes TaxID=68214 RepID=UPI0037A92779